MKILTLALVLASASVHAQNISYLSTGNKPCPSPVNALRAALNEIPYPSTWKFVVVCDDIAWAQAMRHAGDAAAPEYTYGQTFLDQRTTMVRGAYMTKELLNGYPGYLYITAHEMGHVISMSPDDRKADALAVQWLKQ